MPTFNINSNDKPNLNAFDHQLKDSNLVSIDVIDWPKAKFKTDYVFKQSYILNDTITFLSG